MLELSEPLLCQSAVHFEAVWNRVMEGRTSPIVIKHPEQATQVPTPTSCSLPMDFSIIDTPRGCPPTPPNPPSSPTPPNPPSLPTPPNPPCSPTPPNLPIPPSSPSCGQSVSPTPPKESHPPLPCFDDKKSQTFLEEAILSTVVAIEDYKKLERQLPLNLKNTLLSLSLQKRKQRNQLETAYFLLTGEDFLKNTPNTTEYIHPTPIAPQKRLRYRFREAQKWQSLYQKAAFRSEDSCLTSLYLQLESSEKEEVTILHAMVEELFCINHK